MTSPPLVLIRSALPLTALLSIAAAPLLAQVRTPIAGTITVAPPATLTAASSIPTQIVLTWPPASGANGYRVTYTDNAGMPETVLYEGKSGTFAPDPTQCTGSMPCAFVHTNASLSSLYSYRVYGIAYVSPAPIVSDPSPVASARSAPFVAPANATFTVAPSPTKPGQLQATVSWSPVAGAVGYGIAIIPVYKGLTSMTVTAPTVRFDPVRTKSVIGVCIYPIYPSNISDPETRTCVNVIT